MSEDQETTASNQASDLPSSEGQGSRSATAPIATQQSSALFLITNDGTLVTPRRKKAPTCSGCLETANKGDSGNYDLGSSSWYHSEHPLLITKLSVYMDGTVKDATIIEGTCKDMARGLSILEPFGGDPVPSDAKSAITGKELDPKCRWAFVKEKGSGNEDAFYDLSDISVEETQQAMSRHEIPAIDNSTCSVM